MIKLIMFFLILGVIVNNAVFAQNETEVNQLPIGTPFKLNSDSPLQQFKTGILAQDVKCRQGFQLVTKSEDGSPACVKPDTAQKLVERGWAEQIMDGMTQTNNMSNTKDRIQFGITALVIYHPSLGCLGPTSNTTMNGCPPNNFYLKINSNSTAYLLGYNICDGESCTKRNDLSILLPIQDIGRPNFQMIGLPENLQWKDNDTVKIQLYVSSTDDNKTASLLNLGNSMIVP